MELVAQQQAGYRVFIAQAGPAAIEQRWRFFAVKTEVAGVLRQRGGATATAVGVPGQCEAAVAAQFPVVVAGLPADLADGRQQAVQEGGAQIAGGGQGHGRLRMRAMAAIRVSGVAGFTGSDSGRLTTSGRHYRGPL